MKVHGALSVLLDSCICAMAPLIFLTSTIPQIDVIPDETKVCRYFSVQSNSRPSKLDAYFIIIIIIIISEYLYRIENFSR